MRGSRNRLSEAVTCALLRDFSQHGEKAIAKVRCLDAAGCGFKLANDGIDTRALQHYLGHRNIMHTVRYTELRSDRFDGFWKD